MGRAARAAGGQVRAYLDSSRCTRRSVPNEESVYSKQVSCEGGSRATIFFVLLVLVRVRAMTDWTYAFRACGVYLSGTRNRTTCRA
jgi:hypothetical protein